jgi:precorrin-2 dehydrogenase / sirohydrochlorin ferrochelatase
MIPLFVDCSGKLVVIFGGGNVAVRKAERFLKESPVHIISRSFSEACSRLPARFTRIDVTGLSDETLGNLLASAFLVIGTLPDSKENNRIGDICRQKGILFNNAHGEAGDVIIPAVTTGKNYALAITTFGNSPAISRFIRQDLETRYPALDAMIDLQHRLRNELKTKDLTQDQRSDILWNVLNDHHIWELLKKSTDESWAEIGQRYLHG